MHHFDPSTEIQDYLVFGEYGDVNPSITDSSTYTFLNPQTMNELFEHEIEGCFLYSRHWNPTNKYLAEALAKLEDSEAAIVTASGMAAVSLVTRIVVRASRRSASVIMLSVGKLLADKIGWNIQKQHSLLRALTHITATYPGFVGEGAESLLANPRGELHAVLQNADRIGSLASVLRSFSQAAR